MAHRFVCRRIPLSTQLAEKRLRAIISIEKRRAPKALKSRGPKAFQRSKHRCILKHDKEEFAQHGISLEKESKLHEKLVYLTVIMEKAAGLGKNCIVAKKISIFVLFGAAISNLAISVFFWRSNIIGNFVLSSMELRNGTPTFAYWKDPPVRTLYKVRIFNYTNVDRFQSGEDLKLRVEEIGPYIYGEALTRENIVVHENGTLSYQDRREFEYVGGRNDNETIIVPNIPLITLVAKARDKVGFMTGHMSDNILSVAGEEPFIEVKSGKFLWGYESNIYDTAKMFDSILPMKFPSEKFGMLAAKEGFSEDRFTIHSGIGDIDKVGEIQRMNGKKSQGVWSGEECNKIQGTDGTRFSPKILEHRKDTLKVFVKEFCRSLPFQYEGESSAFGVPALRYRLPSDVFTFNETKEACFCSEIQDDSSASSRSCPPAGIYNTSPCTGIAPILTSRPHFYLGDESLQEGFEGLHPREDLHDSFFDIHPRLGVPIAGVTRFQINVEIRISQYMNTFGNIRDGSILPVIWFEAGADDLPEFVLDLLHEGYYTVGTIETIFTWGALLVSLLFTIVAIFTLKKILSQRLKLERLG